MVQFNLVGYLFFALITSITPGPNNFLLFSYGKAYGLRSSGKILFGICGGFMIMLFLAGYGIASIISASPNMGLALKVIASVWFIFLAFVLTRLNSNIKDTDNYNIGFTQAFFMQFVNPKGWIMAINGAAAFLPTYSNVHLNVFIFSSIFALIGIPSMISWILLGDYISKVLKTERSNRILAYTLFVLMLASVVTIWI
jgi:threonine/homoserine/homoserine lactone efflux protein